MSKRNPSTPKPVYLGVYVIGDDLAVQFRLDAGIGTRIMTARVPIEHLLDETVTNEMDRVCRRLLRAKWDRARDTGLW